MSLQSPVGVEGGGREVIVEEVRVGWRQGWRGGEQAVRGPVGTATREVARAARHPQSSVAAHCRAGRGWVELRHPGMARVTIHKKKSSRGEVSWYRYLPQHLILNVRTCCSHGSTIPPYARILGDSPSTLHLAPLLTHHQRLLQAWRHPPHAVVYCNACGTVRSAPTCACSSTTPFPPSCAPSP
jgi:hypothetical protein